MPHIPQGTTDTVALELFEPALDAALRPSPDYDVSRWLYVPNTYSEYRYILGTRGQKSLICVGINPSTAAPDALNKYFGIAQMPTAGSTYWNMVHGLTAEDAPKDEEGMQTMRNLAKNMIWMMRCFVAGKKAGVPYPDTEKQFCTNFIR